MTTACDLVAEEMGSGVAGALTAVDCIASEVSEQAFNRLFGADGQFGTALMVLLTFYIAFFGISLLLGRSNLSVRALIPRMVTVGLVLTFATSFAAFSTIFYTFFVASPDLLAGVLTDSDGSATATFAMKLDIVFLAIQEASTGIEDISAFSPPGMMWIGAMLLLIGTVGLLVTARIGLALLLAVGPIFVVLALFNGTRGLFVGWLKGMVMLALAPLFAVVGGSIMLEMAVPILSALVSTPGQIDQQAAMAFFLVGFVHCMLMLMVLYVGSKMVSGWEVFGFAKPDLATQPNADAYRTASVAPLTSSLGRAVQATPAATMTGPERRINVAMANTVAANDGGGQAGPGTVRETKVYATSSGNTQNGPTSAAASRTRGIGNRFRSASSPRARKNTETSQ